jgi:hypothetical protein
MIHVVSGHLGSGRWRFKDVEGITVLAHMQPFTPHSEFRIGPDQVLSYEVEEGPNKKQLSKILINFTEDRYCRAIVSPDDFVMLDKMVSAQQAAPQFTRENGKWIVGLGVFLVVCVIFEFVK